MTTSPRKTIAAAISRLKEMYRDKEPTDFIAMEFLVSPEILASAQPGSVLWRALRDGEAKIPENGFEWLGTDNRLARIIELTRREIDGGRNVDEVLTVLLTDPEPDFLKALN